MKIRNRLERLEAVSKDPQPGVLCLTAEGLKTLDGQLAKPKHLEGVKVSAGIKPGDL